MSTDLVRGTFSLATIAACSIVIIPVLVLGTRSYDAILSRMDAQDAREFAILDGLKTNHEDLLSIDGRLDEHEGQISKIQASLTEVAIKADAASERERAYQGKN